MYQLTKEFLSLCRPMQNVSLSLYLYLYVPTQNVCVSVGWRRSVSPRCDVICFGSLDNHPFKNEAIHQWMAGDRNKLYTADDIVKARLRYR